MTRKTKRKFATQVDAELLETVRDLAKAEGRQVQSLIDEALADLVEKRRPTRPRRHVMAAYRASLGSHGRVYEKLAE